VVGEVAAVMVADGFDHAALAPVQGEEERLAEHDVERAWVRSDAGGGDWYEGEVFGEPMDNWLCPALLLYFEKPPKRLYVRCDPLPAGVNPIWESPGGGHGRRFIEVPR
jgi:hypothetical protein